MRSRIAASVFVVVLGGGVLLGCGGGSSSKSSSTTTKSTTGGTGAQAAACSAALQIEQQLSSVSGDMNAAVQAAQSAIPELRSLAQQNGVSSATKSAVNNLADALQTAVNGGSTGPNSGLPLTRAAAQLGNACRSVIQSGGSATT